MAKFRKKPVEIEALQLLWTNWNEMCDFLGDKFFAEGGGGCFIDQQTGYPGADGCSEEIGLSIPTLEGLMVGRENDWIIRGIKGELYPCKPDIFEETYELMEET